MFYRIKLGFLPMLGLGGWGKDSPEDSLGLFGFPV